MNYSEEGSFLPSTKHNISISRKQGPCWLASVSARMFLLWSPVVTTESTLAPCVAVPLPDG